MPAKVDFQVRFAQWDCDRRSLQAIREAVFVQEQNIPAELEWDEAVDRRCVHVLALDAVGLPIGTGRLKTDGQIGRMAVLAQWRGKGVGSALLEQLVAAARQHCMTRVWLNAQLRSIPFYTRLGFLPTGEPFQEAGIGHRRMTRALPRLEEYLVHG